MAIGERKLDKLVQFHVDLWQQHVLGAMFHQFDHLWTKEFLLCHGELLVFAVILLGQRFKRRLDLSNLLFQPFTSVSAGTLASTGIVADLDFVSVADIVCFDALSDSNDETVKLLLWLGRRCAGEGGGGGGGGGGYDLIWNCDAMFEFDPPARPRPAATLAPYVSASDGCREILSFLTRDTRHNK